MENRYAELLYLLEKIKAFCARNPMDYKTMTGTRENELALQLEIDGLVIKQNWRKGKDDDGMTYYWWAKLWT